MDGRTISKYYKIAAERGGDLEDMVMESRGRQTLYFSKDDVSTVELFIRTLELSGVAPTFMTIKSAFLKLWEKKHPNLPNPSVVTIRRAILELPYDIRTVIVRRSPGGRVAASRIEKLNRFYHHLKVVLDHYSLPPSKM